MGRVPITQRLRAAERGHLGPDEERPAGQGGRPAGGNAGGPGDPWGAPWGPELGVKKHEEIGMKLDETDKHWRIREADTVDFAQIQTNKEQSRPEKLNKTWRARRNQDQTAS